MIDFSTLQGLTIPEGVVTQITDAAGRVIWVLANDKPIILEVEKITSSTYAGETNYTSENFILLDVYPKNANSTVKVTYGGLTKTLTFTGTNAQEVFFGTFNGVSDSVATPASGELMIEGGFSGFAMGTYRKYNSSTSKTSVVYCNCITAITDWGGTTVIPSNAFSSGVSVRSGAKISSFPDGLKSIGDEAFYNCDGVTVSEFPEGLLSIGDEAFYSCMAQKAVHLPSTINSIGINPWQRPNDSFNNFITINAGNPKYKIDGNCLIDIENNKLIAGFEDAVIPSYIEIIGECAFNGMTIKSLTLPEGVTTIEQYAWLNCRSLETLILPSTVKTIGTDAFARNASGEVLKSVIIRAETPPTAGRSIFDDVEYHSELVITVPAGCGEAYKAADGWSPYANFIVEVS